MQCVALTWGQVLALVALAAVWFVGLGWWIGRLTVTRNGVEVPAIRPRRRATDRWDHEPLP